MNGRIVALAIVLPALLVGGGVWYAQEYGYYQTVAADASAAEIRLVSLTSGAGEEIAAENFSGIDADSSPLRFRGCFRTDISLATATETYRVYPGATPLNAPVWFDCFDAARIGADLGSGAAVAFLSEPGIHPGVDRVVAIYPDGRAFAWNQLAAGEAAGGN